MGLVDNFAASIVKGASIPPEETGIPLNPGELYDRAVTSLTSAANDFNRTVLQPAQQQFTQHVNSFVSDPINYVKVTSAGFDPTKTTEVDPGSMLRGMRGTSATINNQQVFISDSGKVLIKIPGVDGGKDDWVDSTNITQTVGGKLSGTEVKVLDGIRGVEFSGANGEKYFRWPDGKTAKLDPNSGKYAPLNPAQENQQASATPISVSIRAWNPREGKFEQLAPSNPVTLPDGQKGYLSKKDGIVYDGSGEAIAFVGKDGNFRRPNSIDSGFNFATNPDEAARIAAEAKLRQQATEKLLTDIKNAPSAVGNFFNDLGKGAVYSASSFDGLKGLGYEYFVNTAATGTSWIDAGAHLITLGTVPDASKRLGIIIPDENKLAVTMSRPFAELGVSLPLGWVGGTRAAVATSLGKLEVSQAAITTMPIAFSLTGLNDARNTALDQGKNPDEAWDEGGKIVLTSILQTAGFKINPANLRANTALTVATGAVNGNTLSVDTVQQMAFNIAAAKLHIEPLRNPTTFITTANREAVKFTVSTNDPSTTVPKTILPGNPKLIVPSDAVTAKPTAKEAVTLPTGVIEPQPLTPKTVRPQQQDVQPITRPTDTKTTKPTTPGDLQTKPSTIDPSRTPNDMVSRPDIQSITKPKSPLTVSTASTTITAPIPPNLTSGTQNYLSSKPARVVDLQQDGFIVPREAGLATQSTLYANETSYLKIPKGLSQEEIVMYSALLDKVRVEAATKGITITPTELAQVTLPDGKQSYAIVSPRAPGEPAGKVIDTYNPGDALINPTAKYIHDQHFKSLEVVNEITLKYLGEKHADTRTSFSKGDDYANTVAAVGKDGKITVTNIDPLNTSSVKGIKNPADFYNRLNGNGSTTPIERVAPSPIPEPITNANAKTVPTNTQIKDTATAKTVPTEITFKVAEDKTLGRSPEDYQEQAKKILERSHDLYDLTGTNLKTGETVKISDKMMLDLTSPDSNSGKSPFTLDVSHKLMKDLGLRSDQAQLFERLLTPDYSPPTAQPQSSIDTINSLKRAKELIDLYGRTSPSDVSYQPPGSGRNDAIAKAVLGMDPKKPFVPGEYKQVEPSNISSTIQNDFGPNKTGFIKIGDTGQVKINWVTTSQGKVIFLDPNNPRATSTFSDITQGLPENIRNGKVQVSAIAGEVPSSITNSNNKLGIITPKIETNPTTLPPENNILDRAAQNWGAGTPDSRIVTTKEGLLDVDPTKIQNQTIRQNVSQSLADLKSKFGSSAEPMTAYMDRGIPGLIELAGKKGVQLTYADVANANFSVGGNGGKTTIHELATHSSMLKADKTPHGYTAAQEIIADRLLELPLSKLSPIIQTKWDKNLPLLQQPSEVQEAVKKAFSYETYVADLPGSLRYEFQAKMNNGKQYNSALQSASPQNVDEIVKNYKQSLVSAGIDADLSQAQKSRIVTMLDNFSSLVKSKPVGDATVRESADYLTNSIEDTWLKAGNSLIPSRDQYYKMASQGLATYQDISQKSGLKSPLDSQYIALEPLGIGSKTIVDPNMEANAQKIYEFLRNDSSSTEIRNGTDGLVQSRQSYTEPNRPFGVDAQKWEDILRKRDAIVENAKVEFGAGNLKMMLDTRSENLPKASFGRLNSHFSEVFITSQNVIEVKGAPKKLELIVQRMNADRQSSKGALSLSPDGTSLYIDVNKLPPKTSAAFQEMAQKYTPDGAAKLIVAAADTGIAGMQQKANELNLPNITYKDAGTAFYTLTGLPPEKFFFHDLMHMGPNGGMTGISQVEEIFVGQTGNKVFQQLINDPNYANTTFSPTTHPSMYENKISNIDFWNNEFKTASDNIAQKSAKSGAGSILEPTNAYSSVDPYEQARKRVDAFYKTMGDKGYLSHLNEGEKLQIKTILYGDDAVGTTGIIHAIPYNGQQVNYEPFIQESMKSINSILATSALRTTQERYGGNAYAQEVDNTIKLLRDLNKYGFKSDNQFVDLKNFENQVIPPLSLSSNK